MPSSWLVDPTGPTLFAYEFREGRYALVAEVTGDEEWTASLPFPVTIRPSTLLR